MRKENSLSSMLGKLRHDGIYFTQKGNVFEIQGEKDVVNRLSSIENEIVKAHQWYGGIWIYIRIQYKSDDSANIALFATLNFFAEWNERLFSVFRAEWDNWKNEGSHPQPHWHFIYQQESNDLSFNKLSTLKEADFGDFSSLLDEGTGQQIAYLNKMHFAMAGDWFKGGKTESSCSGAEQMSEWIRNVLEHVKSEIKYAQNS